MGVTWRAWSPAQRPAIGSQALGAGRRGGGAGFCRPSPLAGLEDLPVKRGGDWWRGGGPQVGQYGGRRDLEGERGGGGLRAAGPAGSEAYPGLLYARSHRGRARTTGGSGSTAAGCGTPSTTTTRTESCRPATAGGRTTRPAVPGRRAAPPPRRYGLHLRSERQPVVAVAVPPGPLWAPRPGSVGRCR